jgi:integrative and conjugative element protein (TIGR02256 family)
VQTRSGAAGCLWLASESAREMIDEARSWVPCETGGVLLGWRRGPDVVVTHVIDAGPRAQHGQTWFRPDSDWQADRIARLYEDSGRTLSYLGDWHTHPDGRPVPSRRDVRTLRCIAGAAEARCPDPVMLIWGSTGSSADWMPGAFTLRAPGWLGRWRRAHELPIQLTRPRTTPP